MFMELAFALSLSAVGPGTICPGPPAAAGIGFPEYYAIDLVGTRQVTGTGRAAGTAHLTSSISPFGVDLAADGSYRSTLQLQVDHLPVRDGERFVAWVTTPELDQVALLGVLDAQGTTLGTVEWNKFLVVITLESEEFAHGEVAQGAAAMWEGPIVLRGMSRSGRMHTMAGHGPFEQLECRAFGY
jgi:hypothetical protein